MADCLATLLLASTAVLAPRIRASCQPLSVPLAQHLAQALLVLVPVSVLVSVPASISLLV
jgi:hypothetical protein